MRKIFSLKMTSFLFVFFALFLLLPAHSCMANPVDETKASITMSVEHYNKQLKKLKQQEELLLRLKKKIEMLDMPLTEQVKLLDKCENELSAVKSKLSKQEISLTKLSNSIEVLKEDLKILQNQINEVYRQSKHRMNQRNMYAISSIILLLLAL